MSRVPTRSRPLPRRATRGRRPAKSPSSGRGGRRSPSQRAHEAQGRSVCAKLLADRRGQLELTPQPFGRDRNARIHRHREGPLEAARPRRQRHRVRTRDDERSLRRERRVADDRGDRELPPQDRGRRLPEVPHEAVHPGRCRERLRRLDPVGRRRHLPRIDRLRRIGARVAAHDPAARVADLERHDVGRATSASSRGSRRRADSGRPALRAAAACRCSGSAGADRRAAERRDGRPSRDGAASWRSGVMSSRIQKDRAVRRDHEVVVVDDQVADRRRAADSAAATASDRRRRTRRRRRVSVPAKSSPRRPGSSRTTLTGASVGRPRDDLLSSVLPPSCVR